MAFIYILTDPFTRDVFYVGQTDKPLSERKRKHKGLREQDQTWRAHKIRRLLRIGKWNDVGIELIQEVPDSFVSEAERYWIAYYRSIGASLVNTADGGEGNARQTGKRLTEEHKRSISESLRRFNQEHPEAGNNGRNRFQHSEETKRKMSETRKAINAAGGNPGGRKPGYKHTLEARQKMSDTRRRKAAEDPAFYAQCLANLRSE